LGIEHNARTFYAEFPIPDRRVIMEVIMKPESKNYQVEIGGKTLIFETGKLAGQAGGSVTVRLGDALMFGVATMSKEPREGHFSGVKGVLPRKQF
jgi:hypothetical protein